MESNKIAPPDSVEKDDEEVEPWDLMSTRKTLVEVYDFPREESHRPTGSELVVFFSKPPLGAATTTPPLMIYNSETDTYIMEFTETEAATILSHQREYFLNPKDKSSRIRVREFEPPRNQVLLTCSGDINERFLTVNLVKYGIGRCNSIVKEGKGFVATFDTAQEAVELARCNQISVGPETIYVSLYPSADDIGQYTSHSTHGSIQDETRSTYSSTWTEENTSLSTGFSMTDDSLFPKLSGQSTVSGAAALTRPPPYPLPGSHYATSTSRPAPYTLYGNTHQAWSARDKRIYSTMPASAMSARSDVSSLLSSFGSETSFAADSMVSPKMVTATGGSSQRAGAENRPTSYMLSIQTENPETMANLQAYFINTASKKIKQLSDRQFLAKTSDKREFERLIDTTDTINQTGNRIHFSQYKPLPPTVIDVDILADRTPEEMYESVGRYLTRLFPTLNMVKFQQSYDMTRNVLRFDLPAQNIQELLSTKHQLVPGDRRSVLKMRPKLTGRHIRVTVQDKRRMSLGEGHLLSYFGEEGPFCCKVKICEHSPTDAVLEMETCAAARLMVSIGTHQLNDNVVVDACFTEESTGTQPQHIFPTTSDAILVETSTSLSIVKKLMQKYSGYLKEQLSAGEYLFVFTSAQGASKVMENKAAFLDHDIRVQYYSTSADSPEQSTSTSYTHIEVKKLDHISNGEEMFTLLKLHFENFMPTSFKECYDKGKKLFRFDMQSHDISKLLKTDQYIDPEDKRTKLKIVPKATDSRIVVECLERISKNRLTESRLDAAFGPKSSFCSEIVSHHRVSSYEYELEMASCSVASRLVSIGKHELKGGIQVEVYFSNEPETSSDSSGSNEGTITDEETDEGEVQSVREPRVQEPNVRNTVVRGTMMGGTSVPPTILLLSNLDQEDVVDLDTIRYWVKTALGIWPDSIQQSANRGKAVVRLNARPEIDIRSKIGNLHDTALLLHGKVISMAEIQGSHRSLQVTCHSSSKDASISEDDIKVYFTHAKFAGISDWKSLINVQRMKTQGLSQPVFIITYSNDQEAQEVLQRQPLRKSVWQFDVAEFWDDIGLHTKDNYVSYSSQSEHEATAQASILMEHVNSSELDTCKLLMENTELSGGGEIKSCEFLPGKPGLVEVIYKNHKDTERVYQRYENSGLQLNGKPLNMELELPWLNDRHDQYRVRVSGLTDELDPEKLKFYLSALSSNVVTNMSFNQEQTRAIAEFSRPLDYGRLISAYHTNPLMDCPHLKIKQEPKPTDLVASGSMTSRQEIYLHFYKYLSTKFDKNVKVSVEKLPNFSDKWKISTSYEALSYALDGKHAIKGCEQLSIFSSFLGADVTRGVRKKSLELSSLISDGLMLQYLLDVNKPAFNHLANYLSKHGMNLDQEGVISANYAKSGVPAQWSNVQQLVDDFNVEHYCTYSTGPITQQVFSRILQGDHLTNLFAHRSVIAKITDSGDGNTNSTNTIKIVGEKTSVKSLQTKLEDLMRQSEHEIQEEKSVTQSTLPNIFLWHLEYFERSGLFIELKEKYPKIDLLVDRKQRNITIKGIPANIESAQRQIINVLNAITEARLSVPVSESFAKVFASENSQEACTLELKRRGIVAVWTLKDFVISIYSATTSASRDTQATIFHVIQQYELDLDELQCKIVGTDVWNRHIEKLCDKYAPLEIEIAGRSKLFCIGLMCHKLDVNKEMSSFLEANVERSYSYQGCSFRIQFLEKFKSAELKKLETQCNVVLQVATDHHSIKIVGSQSAIAACRPLITKLHNSVLNHTHTVKGSTKVQHITATPSILPAIGTKTRCVLALKDVPKVFETVTPGSKQQSTSLEYSARLPVSSVVCEVRKGDVTTLATDGIVIPANPQLRPAVGPLCEAVYKKGGPSIQSECRDILDRCGNAMLWTAVTTSSGNLPCSYIIHAVCSLEDGSNSQISSLGACIEQCFIQAEETTMQSLAIPPICAKQFKKADVIKRIVNEISSRDLLHQHLPQRIVLIDVDSSGISLFKKELQAEIETTASQVNLQQPIASGPTANYTVNKTKVTILGKFQLEMVDGDLSASKEESVVISVGSDLNLKDPKAASAIDRVAGPGLQNELNTSFKSINEGDVIHTSSGYKLPWKTVICCCCPDGRKGQSSNTKLKDIVTKCLSHSESVGCKSVAFHSLGTGQLNFDPNTAAQLMVESIIAYYVQKNPNSSLIEVKVYHKDRPISTAFQKELQRLSSISQSSSQKKFNLDPAKSVGSKGGVSEDLKGLLKGYATVNNTHIRIIHGDITEHQADVLVNSASKATGTPNDRGEVSKVLLARAGDPVKKEIVRQIARDQEPSDGIWQTKAGNLQADHIFHVNTDYAAPDEQEAGDKGFMALVGNCLNRFDASDFGSSIAFPALGTGRVMRSPHKDMAKIILETVLQYLNSHPQSRLRNVDVVIYTAPMAKEFVASLEAACKRLGPWWARFNPVQALVNVVSEFVHPKKENKELIIDIYAESREDIEACQVKLDSKLDKAVQTVMWSDKKSYSRDEAKIARLTQQQRNHLYAEANKLDLVLEIKQGTLNNIKIHGLNDAVSEFEEKVREVLADVDHLFNTKRIDRYLARSIRWKYLEDGDWIRFSDRLNRDLEEQFRSNALGTYEYDSADGKVTIDFSKMEGIVANSGMFEIRREDIAAPIVPNTWKAPYEQITTFPLRSNCGEFDNVKNEFESTLGKRCQIIKIERIQNLALYQQYVLIRKQTGERLKQRESAVEKAYLWHGTNDDTAKKIIHGKFDRGYAGTVNATAYGKGIYFATDSSYSAQEHYSRPNAAGEKIILATRVVTGEWCRGSSDMLGAPEKPHAPGQQYDSVVDNVGSPTIFVVFHDASAYPEYIIRFKLM